MQLEILRELCKYEFDSSAIQNNVCFKKIVTIQSSDTLLWIVTVFLKQKLKLDFQFLFHTIRVTFIRNT